MKINVVMGLLPSTIKKLGGNKSKTLEELVAELKMDPPPKKIRNPKEGPRSVCFRIEPDTASTLSAIATKTGYSYRELIELGLSRRG